MANSHATTITFKHGELINGLWGHLALDLSWISLTKSSKWLQLVTTTVNEYFIHFKEKQFLQFQQF